MATWFQARIKFVQEDEKGVSRNINQIFLFDAVSYTDAEARAYHHLAAEVPDFQMVGLSKLKLNEVFFEDNGADIWFKCKVSYIVFDEKSQKEKKVPFVFLLNAQTVKEAYGILEIRLGSVQDYIITDIGATKILDVIPYQEEDIENETKPEALPHTMRPMAEVMQAAAFEEEAQNLENKIEALKNEIEEDNLEEELSENDFEEIPTEEDLNEVSEEELSEEELDDLQEI